jgi:uncharacterized protein
MIAPFIKTFATESHCYVYDVNSNEILRVTPLMKDALEELSETPRRDIPAKLAQTYDTREVEECLAEIDSLRFDQDLFSSRRPSRLRLPFDRGELKRKLASGLKLLTLGVTESCNLRCRYCTYSGRYQNSRAHSSRTMTLATALKAVDLYLASSDSESERGLGFYGGEPLLAIGLIRGVVDHVAGLGRSPPISFHLTTNGVLLERAEVREFLVDNDVQILISLDGPAGAHDRMRRDRRGGATHAKIMTVLRLLQKEHPSYVKDNVGFSVCATTAESLQLARSFFADNSDLCESGLMTVALIDPTDSTLEDEGIVRKDWDRVVDGMVQDYLECLFEGSTPEPFLQGLLGSNFSRIRSHIHQRSLEPLAEEPPPLGICIPGYQRLFCTAAGDFTLCERLNAELTIGDVDHGIDVDAVWRIVTEYTELSSPDCTDCWALRFCGMCYREIYGQGFDLERKRRYCDLERDRWRRNLELYCTGRERRDDVFDS